MSYKIDIIDSEKYKIAHASMKDELNIEITLTIAKETLKIINEKKITRVLWDIRDTIIKESFVESHTYAQGLHSFGIKSSDKIAVLYNNNSEYHKKSAKTTVKLGYFNVLYFTDYNEAVEWLKK